MGKANMAVTLRRGDMLSIQRAIAARHGCTPVARATIRRVAGGTVSRWSGEAELVREELLARGMCPAGYVPEARRDRWSDVEVEAGKVAS